MTTINQDKIRCSVGILTYNSEKNLRRALESVKDFTDIIISDGGSTDNTIAIAKEYSATIIDQWSKNNPGPDVHHPIADFARERNRMLEVAKEDWFFWIDSDEYISTELESEIRSVCNGPQDVLEFFAFEIPIAVQSPDATVTYKRPTTVYQTRFFNRKSGGIFERVIHERFVYDKKKYPTGRMKGVWYVPLSKPDFDSYSKAVNYRLRVMILSNPPTSLILYMRKGIFMPLRCVASALYNWFFTQVKFKKGERMPFFYYRNRLYSQWVKFRISTELYVKILLGR